MTLAEPTLAALDTVTAALPAGGERREGQREMAAAVAEAAARGGHVVVQAGTGTGKSLAYLVPTVLSGGRVVIATATKALQDQLAGKDLPFLAEHLGVDIDFTVLKGRSNYLCRQRLDEVESADQLELEIPDISLDAATVAGLHRFAEQTESGDRADLTLDVDDRTWRLVSVTRDECPGAARCPHGHDCFAESARARAAEADVVVVNLHLYALHVTTQEILDEHDIVVIDEAHQLETIVSEAAGRALTPGRCTALARAAGTVLAERDATEAIDELAGGLRDRLQPLIGQRLPDGPDAELQSTLELIRVRVDRLVQAVRKVPDDAPEDVLARVRRVRQSATSLLLDIDAVRFPTEDDVAWVDGPAGNPSLRTTPLRIDDLLAEGLWSKRAAVLTSATLPPNLAPRVGLPDSTEVIDVGSPFDYENNALLYCPTHLPDPRASDRREERLAELEELIVAAGGRTLALFTSFAAMQEAADHLAVRLPWPVLVQGDKAKAALLDEFARDEESSLFATMSFWQGVDVPGRSCSLVVIDRLPFPRPDEPVLQARRELAGSSAFRMIDLPRAATMLAQGAGRLIRSADDRGVVAVLDPRLATARSYRWELIKALPPMPRSRDRHEVTAFLRSLRDE